MFSFNNQTAQRTPVTNPGVFNSRLKRISHKFDDRDDSECVLFTFDIEKDNVFYYKIKFRESDSNQSLKTKYKIILNLVSFLGEREVKKIMDEAKSPSELASQLEMLRGKSPNGFSWRKINLVENLYNGNKYITIDALNPPYYM